MHYKQIMLMVANVCPKLLREDARNLVLPLFLVWGLSLFQAVTGEEDDTCIGSVHPLVIN